MTSRAIVVATTASKVFVRSTTVGPLRAAIRYFGSKPDSHGHTHSDKPSKEDEYLDVARNWPSEKYSADHYIRLLAVPELVYQRDQRPQPRGFDAVNAGQDPPADSLLHSRTMGRLLIVSVVGLVVYRYAETMGWIDMIHEFLANTKTDSEMWMEYSSKVVSRVTEIADERRLFRDGRAVPDLSIHQPYGLTGGSWYVKATRERGESGTIRPRFVELCERKSDRLLDVCPDD